jgi:hypothetical protein
MYVCVCTQVRRGSERLKSKSLTQVKTAAAASEAKAKHVSTATKHVSTATPSTHHSSRAAACAGCGCTSALTHGAPLARIEAKSERELKAEISEAEISERERETRARTEAHASRELKAPAANGSRELKPAVAHMPAELQAAAAANGSHGPPCSRGQWVWKDVYCLRCVQQELILNTALIPP